MKEIDETKLLLFASKDGTPRHTSLAIVLVRLFKLGNRTPSPIDSHSEESNCSVRSPSVYSTRKSHPTTMYQTQTHRPAAQMYQTQTTDVLVKSSSTDVSGRPDVPNTVVLNAGLTRRQPKVLAWGGWKSEYDSGWVDLGIYMWHSDRHHPYLSMFCNLV